MESLHREIRNDWTLEEIEGLLALPLEKLLTQASDVHRKFGAQDIQKCKLLSIKTGHCPEDCGYCSQSAHYQTGVQAESLLPHAQVLTQGQEAKAQGATRFCL